MNTLTTSSDMTSFSTGILSSSLLIYGAVFLAIVVIFIWRAKGIAQSAFGFVLLFALSLALPASLLISNKQTNVGSKAAISVKTLNVAVNKLANNQFAVTFETSEPVVAYVEYKDVTLPDYVPVLPQYSLTAKNAHSILVSAKSSKGGSAYLMINGEKYLPNNALLELK